MKFLFRWVFRLLIFLIVLAVAALLLKDTILKSLAEHRLRARTGMEATIGRLEVGVFTPTITVEDLKLFNPPEFGATPLIDLPELHLEYDPAALWTGQLHFRTVRLNLHQVNVVENKAGVQSTEMLYGQIQRQVTGARPKRAGFTFTGIDTLNLTVGRLRFLSYRDPSQNWERDIGFQNEVAYNIRNESDLTVAVFRVLIKNGLRALKPAPPAVEPRLERSAPTPAPAAKRTNEVVPPPRR
jgi:uncharacterized protein involved in outer membrane biogenesis